jgi:predicted NBD/HSP70 family sugar kinase
MLEEGVVREVGLEESDGGRPRVMLQVNNDFGVAIGVEVGETFVRVEAFDMGMQAVGSVDMALHPRRDEASVVIDHIAAAVEKLQAQFAAQGKRVLGVGIALPGVVSEQDGGSWAHAPSIGWRDVPLEEMICQRVGLPVFADNDAKALGQAEMWLGAGRGTSHAVVVHWGTGIGAAVFTNGRLYRGARTSAGEWGHTGIVANGKRCRCGAAGCVEAYIGGPALLEEWHRAVPGAVPSPGNEPGQWVDCFLEDARTNEAAAAALDRAATYLGVGAANLANLFDPEKIILDGWLGLKLGPVLLEKIRKVVQRQALEYMASRVRIEVGQLGPNAVVLGASTLVVDELLSNGGAPLAIGATWRQPDLS